MSDDFDHSYRTWHAKISYVKSAVRIASCLTAYVMHADPSGAIIALACGFGLAELLGIAEEWI